MKRIVTTSIVLSITALTLFMLSLFINEMNKNKYELLDIYVADTYPSYDLTDNVPKNIYTCQWTNNDKVITRNISFKDKLPIHERVTVYIDRETQSKIQWLQDDYIKAVNTLRLSSLYILAISFILFVGTKILFSVRQQPPAMAQ